MTEDKMLSGIANSTSVSLSKLRETGKDREARRAAVRGLQGVRHNSVTEQQQQI